MCAVENNIPVSMVKALPGFPDIYSFRLQKIPGNSLFFWLESQDGPSFILTKPGLFFNDYLVKINKNELVEELLAHDDDIEVYSIVTVPDNPADMTTNLMAPLLINEATGLGCQVVLHDSQYTTRHHLY
ncbi:MAG: flagellar assembly protein FliW, partial [Firmicutes bacterium]|nr:flagellar assembly protein FliW [Bacillota bacterium]